MTIKSPLGALEVAVDSNGAIKAINYSDDNAAKNTIVKGVQAKAEKQLGDYFAGKRKNFDVPLMPQGTEFQQAVWQALLTIPFGETRTYGDIARQIGKPKAVRAVGAACGKNPISIVIPCHRVVGSNGGLTGYAGGLDKKAWLLEFEAG